MLATLVATGSHWKDPVHPEPVVALILQQIGSTSQGDLFIAGVQKRTRRHS